MLRSRSFASVIAPESTPDRWYRVLVDHEIGSEQVTQFVGSIPPGRAPDHFHTYEEVLFILKGEGRMWAGQTNTPIGPVHAFSCRKGRCTALRTRATANYVCWVFSIRRKSQRAIRRLNNQWNS
jgi:uncharacterized cupin superfamily protein